jgi:hypothetical protein
MGVSMSIPTIYHMDYRGQTMRFFLLDDAMAWVELAVAEEKSRMCGAMDKALTKCHADGLEMLAAREAEMDRLRAANAELLAACEMACEWYSEYSSDTLEPAGDDGEACGVNVATNLQSILSEAIAHAKEAKPRRPSHETLQDAFKNMLTYVPQANQFTLSRENAELLIAEIERVRAAEQESADRENEACANLALQPYSDAVECLGSMEPQEVGRRIATAIRTRRKTQ